MNECKTMAILEGLDLKYIQIVTATETKENAEKIADILVKNRLAGCVQVVGPAASTYRWKGKVEKTTEWLCIVKTRRDLYGKVEASILHNHTYKVPEILAVSLIAGYESYLAWLSTVVEKME